MPRYIVQVDPSRLVVLQQALPSVPLVKLVGKPVFGAVVIEAPESALPAIRALEGVKRIELDKKVSAAAVATVGAELNEIRIKGPLAFLTLSLPRRSMVPTSLSRKVMGADVAESLGVTGEGVKVAVIDTGGDPTHPQMLGQPLKSAMLTQPVGYDENGHGCVEGGAYVYTTFCGLVPLELLWERMPTTPIWIDGGWVKESLGEVFTIGFNTKAVPTRVKAIHKIPFDGEVVDVQAGTAAFVTSPWHPFLVYHSRSKKRSYVRADMLHQAHRNYGLAIADTDVALPFSGSVSLDMAYLAGLAIAEGCLSSYAVQLGLHKREAPVIVAFIKRLGGSCSLYPDKRSQGAVVGIYGTMCRQLRSLVTLQGDGRGRIPERLLKQPAPIVLALLAGLIDGDGHFDKDRARFRLATTSEVLAVQVVNLLSALGFDGRITSQVPSARGRQRCWQVSIGPESFERFCRAIGPLLKLKAPECQKSRRRHPYLLVKRITKRSFKGHLYDLTTDTGNYLAGKRGMAFIHNTHVATTIAGKGYWHPYGSLLGVAPKAQLIVIKALGYVIGSGSWSEILRAMDMAATLGADVISMSLGGSDDSTDREDTGFMAIEQMGQSGIAVVIAAGNSGPKPGTIGYPGAAPAALTVGAIDENLQLADFSSRGPTRLGLVKPDVVAPGVNILSGTTGLIAAYRAIDGFRVGALSGTSMATPMVSGLVALARQYAKQKGVPRSNPGAITAEHVKQAMEKVSGAKSNDHGYGLVTFPILKAYIDALAAIESNLAATGLATG